MKLKKIKLNDMVSPDYNPRVISEGEFNLLRNSIGEFGLVDPIIINLKNNHIIGGNQRFKLLKENGVEELNLFCNGDIGWCFTDTELEVKDDNYEKALNIALNKINGDFHNLKLDGLLKELDNVNVDLELCGFENLENKNVNDTKVEEEGFNILIEFSSKEELDDCFDKFKNDGLNVKKIVW